MKTKLKNLNEYGIAHLALILGAIVLIVIVAAAFRVVKHERSGKSESNTSQSTTDGKKSELNDSTGMLNGIPLTDTGQTDQPTSSQQTSGGSSGTTKSPSPSAPKSTTIQGSQPSTSSGSSGSTSSPPTTSDNGDTPQVTLTYPSYWGQTVSGTITMTATASDSSGVQKVVFMIRRIGYATPIYTQADTTAPYSGTFDTTTLPNGGSEYTVEAQVFDNTGKGNLASYRINIQN